MQKKLLIEVVKGNSIWELDNFTEILNKLADNEAMSTISARLLYMYYNALW
jgi:hypothetical protein